MPIRQLIATTALACFAASSLAAEYTNFEIEPSTLSRADVRAQFEIARAAGELDEVTAEIGSFTHEEIASTRDQQTFSLLRKLPVQRRNTGNYVGG